MKKEKMLRAIGGIDEKYIAEADPNKKAHRSKNIRLRLGLLAACICCVITAANLWLFVPFNTDPPDISEYRDSEYYSIIERLNAVTYVKPAYKNNFHKYVSAVGNFFGGMFSYKNDAGAMDGVAEEIGSAAPQQYREVTDNQVQGVIESDLIKRSDRYIYYMSGATLKIYSIEGLDSVLVGQYTIKGTGNYSQYYMRDWQIYLSEDCETVTVVASLSSKVSLISLDVTDPANVKEKDRVTVSGAFLSSRMVDGKILLFSRFFARTPDFSKEETFVPQIESEGRKESIPMEDIVYPDVLTANHYTVVCKVDEDTLAVEGSAAFLSYSTEVYVSLDNVYAMRQYSEQVKDAGVITQSTMTEISILSYSGEEMEHKGSVQIAGYVKDQYSLDEYEGVLRVVTTTSVNRYVEKYANASGKENEGTVSVTNMGTVTNASLWCIDLTDRSVIAKKEHFAPDGEVVYSVRFDGTAAYVCTAVQATMSDPVFFFDLSDLCNITYTDTGTIEGYSTSLIQLGDGYLLGIGYGEDRGTLKVEIYEETAYGVVSVCKYEASFVSFSEDYKSYFVDRENDLIGLGVYNYNSGAHNGKPDRYILLGFDGYDLIEVVNTELMGANETKRGVLIDGHFYMFADNDFKVTKLR